LKMYSVHNLPAIDDLKRIAREENPIYWLAYFTGADSSRQVPDKVCRYLCVPVAGEEQDEFYAEILAPNFYTKEMLIDWAIGWDDDTSDVFAEALKDWLASR